MTDTTGKRVLMKCEKCGYLEYISEEELKLISDLPVERHIKYTKKIKLNARRHNVKFRSIQII